MIIRWLKFYYSATYLKMPSFSRSENLLETSSTKCFRHMSNPTARRPVPRYHRLGLIAILFKDPILSRLSTSFRTDITMTSEWTGLRSLRPSLTQVGSGENYVLRCSRFTDFMRRGTNTGAMMGAAHVVTTSVGMCDVDLRCLFCVINYDLL